MTSIAQAGQRPREGGARFLKPEAVTGYASSPRRCSSCWCCWPILRLGRLHQPHDRVLGTGKFIGIGNYLKLLQDSLFRETVWNSFVYTLSTVFLKMALGSSWPCS